MVRVVGKTATGVGAALAANTVAVNPAISLTTVRSLKGLVTHGAKQHLLKTWIRKIDAEIGKMDIAVGLVDKIRNLVTVQRDMSAEPYLSHDQVLRMMTKTTDPVRRGSCAARIRRYR